MMTARIGPRDLVVFLILEGLVLSGCRSTYTISTEELIKLDGFEAGSVVELVDIGGETHEFTESTGLSLIIRGVGETPVREFRWISVDEVAFFGVTVDGSQSVDYPLDDILSARLYVLEPGNILDALGAAAGLVVGIAVTAVAAFAVLVFIFLIVVFVIAVLQLPR